MEQLKIAISNAAVQSLHRFNLTDSNQSTADELAQWWVAESTSLHIPAL